MMDGSTDEFSLDLSNFDIPQFVGDGNGTTDGGQGGSMFDDQQARDKARIQAQRSLMHTPGSAAAYYGYQDSNPDTGTISPSSNPASLPPLSLEQLNLLLNVGLSNPSIAQDSLHGAQGAGSALANTADALKEQLAQQIKLQQLQQLQNHILQQQIQLLTAGARGIASKDVQQLLTPASSTDIRSGNQSTQVSPNILPPGMFHPSHPSSNRMHPTHFNPNSTMSAPASLAFNMSGQPMQTPQSPASDFLTPLTSPVFPPVSSHRGNVKRSADVFEGDLNDGSGSMGSGSGARKRPAHSNSFGNLNLNMGMTTVSPALLSSVPKNRRPSLGGGGPMDTPSPIDLSMPPPAAPPGSGSTSGYMTHHHSHQHPHMGMPSGDAEMTMPLTIQGSDRRRVPSGPPSSNTGSSSNNVSPDLMPATPSLLMNMGNLSLPPGLVPPMMDQSGASSTEKAEQQQQQSQQPQRRGKNVSRSRGLSTSAVQSSSTSSTSVATAAKTRRAAAAAAAASAGTGGAGRATSGGASGSGRTTSFSGPKVKSTHKDAEQKRRDSLKTSFDELRLLLPPIPLSSNSTGPLAGFGLAGDDSDEAPLPGAMPPRGPPRGEGDGPNKGVSKLVLLRCGNEFIRDLVGRVNRRDEEIEKLRNELRRLRVSAVASGISAMGMVSEEMMGSVDLDKDMEKEDEWYREERRRARKKKMEEEDQENME